MDAGSSLLVAAPTGAGKTLVAEYAVDICVAAGRRAIYTAPIKALSNQKFRDFTARYGDKVGIKTGDVTLNPDAQIILMTTEIFRNTIFESPESLGDVHYVVFDEIHYLDDIERGTVWEESIIYAPPHIRFLCLSATVPNLESIAEWIRKIRPDVPLEVVLETERPVPLRHQVVVPGLGVRSLAELKKLESARDFNQYFRRLDPRSPAGNWRGRLIDHLAEQDRLPALWFAFNRRECAELARSVRRPLLDEEGRREILGLYEELLGRFQVVDEDATREFGELLSRGVAYHHAGLLPTLKEVVERIFTSGLIKLLFATETFAVGINMPARTVVFNTLHKFDGTRVGFLRTREHHQMAGRAGRRGIDEVGWVYSASEWPHVRAASIERVIHGQVEPIRSQFNLSYATLLALVEHLGGRIVDVAEKSFANFQSGGAAPTKRAVDAKKRQMRSKLKVLTDLGYLEDWKLTAKGRFAKNIQGYELQVTEIADAGVMDGLKESELAVLFCGITYESKKADWHRKHDTPRLKGMRKAAYRAVDPILKAEERHEVEDPTKELDFKLMNAVQAWAEGCRWDELPAYTGAGDGDLVRHFRLAIQLLRTTAYALDPKDPLRPRLKGAVSRINRDVVDAERQLRMGVSDLENAPPPAPAEPGPPFPVNPGEEL